MSEGNPNHDDKGRFSSGNGTKLSDLMKTKDGSEKQKSFATDIANRWLKEIDDKIDEFELRNSIGDKLEKYSEALEANKSKFIEGLSKMTTKQIIDLHMGKRNPAKMIIDQALK